MASENAKRPLGVELRSDEGVDFLVFITFLRNVHLSEGNETTFECSKSVVPRHGGQDHELSPWGPRSGAQITLSPTVNKHRTEIPLCSQLRT